MAARPKAPKEQEQSPAPEIVRQVPDFIGKDNYELLVEAARKLGEYLKNTGVTASQIRGIFGEVRRIEMQWEKEIPGVANRLLMLRPRLFYQANRFPKVRPLQEVLDRCIREVGGDGVRFRRFVDFFEAIVAYHGG